MRLSPFVLHFRLVLLSLLLSQASALVAAPAPQKPASAKARPPQPVLPDSLAQRLERAYFVLSRVNGIAHRSSDTDDLSEDLPTVEENLATIRQNLDGYRTAMFRP